MGRFLTTAPPNTVVGLVPQAQYPDGSETEIEMIEKFRDVVIARACTAMTYASAGTGYAVGEIFSVDSTGGTFPSTFARDPEITGEVTAESGGVPSEVRIRNAGAHVTDPSTTTGAATATLNGAGTGMLVDITMAAPVWTLDRETSEVSSAVVLAGGSGYTDSATVTLTDGGPSITAATATISVTTGAITSFAITDGGIFDRLPTTLNVIGGDGAGGTATPTYGSHTGATQDREMLFSSTLTDGPHIGIRTHNSRNWELAAFTSIDTNAAFDAQPGISLGRYDGVGDDADGNYVVLRQLTNPDFFNFFINVTNRRIIAIFNVDNAIYTTMYLGFINQVGTTVEYPYPMLVGGCAAVPNTAITTTASQWSGMTLPLVASDVQQVRGPMMIRDPGGVYRTIRVGVDNSSNINGFYDRATITPAGTHDPSDVNITDANRFFEGTIRADWSNFAGSATLDGAVGDDAPDEIMFPAISGAGLEQAFHEVILHNVFDEVILYGELDEIRWTDRTTDVGVDMSAEDEFDVGTGPPDLWIAFHNCRNTARQHWFVMKASP